MKCHKDTAWRSSCYISQNSPARLAWGILDFVVQNSNFSRLQTRHRPLRYCQEFQQLKCHKGATWLSKSFFLLPFLENPTVSSCPCNTRYYTVAGLDFSPFLCISLQVLDFQLFLSNIKHCCVRTIKYHNQIAWSSAVRCYPVICQPSMRIKTPLSIKYWDLIENVVKCQGARVKHICPIWKFRQCFV